MVKPSISSFEETLDNRFICVHHSYIINRNKITAYTKKDIKKINEFEIPIGDNYKKKIYLKWTLYI